MKRTKFARASKRSALFQQSPWLLWAKLVLPRSVSLAALCLASLFSMRQHARMPLLIFGVWIAERGVPMEEKEPPAGCAVHQQGWSAMVQNLPPDA